MSEEEIGISQKLIFGLGKAFGESEKVKKIRNTEMPISENISRHEDVMPRL